MSDADICSDNEKYGGFGAAMANSVAADSAAPPRAVAAVAAVCAPGTKKSLPVTVAEHIWKTKGRSKHQKKSNVPAHVLQAAAPAPQAEAPAAVPAPVPLVTADNDVAQAPVGRKKSPPVLPAVPAVAPAPFSFGEPIYPTGIVIDVRIFPPPPPSWTTRGIVGGLGSEM